MSDGPSIADIIAQFAVPDNVGRSADEWLADFSTWLERDYNSLVHHSRAPGLHCSQLYKTCARKEVLMEVFGAVEDQKTAGNYLTFDVGHALHYWWQNRYLGPKGELWGDWFCAGCKSTTRGFMPMNCSCGVPWQDAVTYVELEARDDELGYVGHTDGILINRQTGHRRLFEFKTMGSNEFMELRSPKPEHVIQTHAYMRALELQEVLIVYEDKGRQCDWQIQSGGRFLATNVHIKPFIVAYDPMIWAPIEERIRDWHVAHNLLQEILSEGRRPAQGDVTRFRRVCESPHCSTARLCPVSKQCFSLGVDG